MSITNNRRHSAAIRISVDDNSDLTVEDVLLDLQPIIHFFAQFTRLIQWKEDVDSKQSLLLLLVWIIWWSTDTCILYSLPMISLITIIKANAPAAPAPADCKIEEIKNSSSTDDKIMMIKEDLIEIRDTLYLLFSVKKYIQKSDTLCMLYDRHYSVATVKQRTIICLGVACLFIITYAGWAILLYQQTIQSFASIMWFTVFMIMCLCSPWITLVFAAITHVAKTFIYYFLIDTRKESSFLDSNIVKQEQYITNGYCFELYHHQRWWFLNGWSNLLLSQDRPVWSDIYQETAPSIYKFQLPPATYIGKPDKMNLQKTVSWIWIDPYWTIQNNDKLSGSDGWQYGSWKWKSWTSQSSGLSLCTRRRKWIRRAQRIESWVQVDNNSMEEQEDIKSSRCSSLIGGSDTTTSSSSSSMSSIYNWNNTNHSTRSLSLPSLSFSNASSVKPVFI